MSGTARRSAPSPAKSNARWWSYAEPTDFAATGYSSVSAWSYRGEKQRRRVSEPPLAGADPAAQERLDYGNGALTDDCAYAW